MHISSNAQQRFETKKTELIQEQINKRNLLVTVLC